MNSESRDKANGPWPASQAGHGAVVREIGGLDHWFAFYEDGTAEGVWSWSAVRLRKPVRFLPTPDGGLVPEARGQRRKQILEEVGYLLDQVGPFQPEGAPTAGTFDGVRTMDKRGRKPGSGLDPEVTRNTVAKARAADPDVSVTRVIHHDVAHELALSVETVQDHLYRRRTARSEPLPRLSAAEQVPLTAVEAELQNGRWAFDMAEALAARGHSLDVSRTALAYYLRCDPDDVESWYELGQRQRSNERRIDAPSASEVTLQSVMMVEQRIDFLQAGPARGPAGT